MGRLPVIKILLIKKIMCHPNKTIDVNLFNNRLLNQESNVQLSICAAVCKISKQYIV